MPLLGGVRKRLGSSDAQLRVCRLILVFHQTLVEEGKKEGLPLQTVQEFLIASPQMIPLYFTDVKTLANREE